MRSCTIILGLGVSLVVAAYAGHDEFVAPAAHLPLIIDSGCDEDVSSGYYPGAYMGFHEGIDIDSCWREYPRDGESCVRIKYNGHGQWAGVVWASPPNDWGDEPGGYDLSKATSLSFWARGETGLENVEFKMGILKGKRYSDSGSASVGKVRLSNDWKRYTMNLHGKNLKQIKTAFACMMVGGDAVTFYLDDIKYEY